MEKKVTLCCFLTCTMSKLDINLTNVSDRSANRKVEGDGRQGIIWSIVPEDFVINETRMHSSRMRTARALTGHIS